MKPAVFRSVLLMAVVIFTPSALVCGANQASAQPTHPELYTKSFDITASPGNGLFIADGWEVKISKSSNGYTYQGKNSNVSITLFRGRSIKAGDKHIYKWNNSGTVYQVTWQPTDPKYIRVKIFNPRSKEIFNKLMWNTPEI